METTYKILKVIIAVLSLVALLLAANTLYEHLKDRVQAGGLATVEIQETGEDTAAASGSNKADGAQTQEETHPREMAPDFTVYDLEGNACKLSDFRGKPVIVNFWASWCMPCKSEMPAFEEKYKQYGDDIQFMMVDLTDGAQETVESGSAYILSQGYTFPVYYDVDISGAIAYSVTSIPFTCFIDEEGRLAAWYPAAMSEDILQQGIDLLLNP